jgi:hypothetical protein
MTANQGETALLFPDQQPAHSGEVLMHAQSSFALPIFWIDLPCVITTQEHNDEEGHAHKQ